MHILFLIVLIGIGIWLHFEKKKAKRMGSIGRLTIQAYNIYFFNMTIISAMILVTFLVKIYGK